MTVWLDGPLALRLPPLRLVSRPAREYAGACPFCGGDERRSDRFHLWLDPPERARYWCRRCGRRGSVGSLLRELGIDSQPIHAGRDGDVLVADRPVPDSADIPHYRAIYGAIVEWTEAWLRDPLRGDPARAHLARRGIILDGLPQLRLGYAINDPTALVTLLATQTPALLPYAEAAGVAVRTRRGRLVTAPSLRGTLVIPYERDGAVWDIRTRNVPGSGYMSLRGSYALRGATTMYGWNVLQTRPSATVALTEGELKALAVNAAYLRGHVPVPTLAHPGLSYVRREWPGALRRMGVQTVILAYDARALGSDSPPAWPHEWPEAYWTLRHGAMLRAAGLRVFVATLPITPPAQKEDLDGLLARAGVAAVEACFRTAQPLARYREAVAQRLACHPDALGV